MAEFALDRILFVPSGNPPHKHDADLTQFAHRYAMVALACAGESRFVPSLLEAPTTDGSPRFSIDTARIVRQRLGPRDSLFFLIGVDAFLDIQQWKDYRDLLDLVNFIVVTRPGFDAQEISHVLPRDMLAARNLEREGSDARPKKVKSAPADTIVLCRTTLHILRGIHVPAASRDIRQAVREGLRISGLVPADVEQYMVKEGLYRVEGPDTL